MLRACKDHIAQICQTQALSLDHSTIEQALSSPSNARTINRKQQNLISVKILTISEKKLLAIYSQLAKQSAYSQMRNSQRSTQTTGLPVSFSARYQYHTSRLASSSESGPCPLHLGWW